MNVSQRKTAYAEAFGVLLEQMGFPRMAGRIWGWLLTCDPAEQTAAAIGEGVRASRGSVSMMTRLLIQLGLVERVGKAGARSGYYRIKAGGFTEVLEAKMRFTREIRRMAERGLGLLAGEPEGVRRRLEEYRDMCLFFEREFPALIEKWRGERRETAQ